MSRSHSILHDADDDIDERKPLLSGSQDSLSSESGAPSVAHVVIDVKPPLVTLDDRLKACIELLNNQKIYWNRKQQAINGASNTLALIFCTMSLAGFAAIVYIEKVNDIFNLLPKYNNTKIPHSTSTTKTCGDLYPIHDFKDKNFWQRGYKDPNEFGYNYCTEKYYYYEDHDSDLRALLDCLLIVVASILLTSAAGIAICYRRHTSTGPTLADASLPFTMQEQVLALAKETDLSLGNEAHINRDNTCEINTLISLFKQALDGIKQRDAQRCAFLAGKDFAEESTTPISMFFRRDGDRGIATETIFRYAGLMKP